MAIEVIIDVGEIQGMVDAMNSIGQAISERSFTDKAARRLAAVGRDTFNIELDQAAQAAPEMFHHVYEWGQVGSPAGRLFRLVVVPSSGGADIAANFLPSTTLPPETRPVGDTISVRFLRKDGRWYTREMEIRPQQERVPFSWKAPIMEEGVTVNIQAKNANMLFWIDDKTQRGYMARTVNIDYSTKPTMGQFAEAWNMFWSEMAESMVIRPRMKQSESTLSTLSSKAIYQQAKKKSHIPVAGPTAVTGAGINVRFTNNGKPFSGRFRPAVLPQVRKRIQRRILAVMR